MFVCLRARVARRLRAKCLFKSNKRALNQTFVSVIWKSFEISTKFNTKTLCTVTGNWVTKCGVMLHTAFQRWGCHIWACRERESGSDRVCR